MTAKDNEKLGFQFFNEVGIIHQLATSLFNRRLPEGLHVAHFSVLNHLIRLGDGKTPLALASAFQVTKGTMTHTLSTLHDRGFIALSPHATDGRSKLVHLTEAGREFHHGALESLAPVFETLSGQLDFAALGDVLPVLQNVRQTLDQNRDA